MEAMISRLVSRFEKGKLSRRELVQGLTAIAATGSTALGQETVLKATKVDHVSIQVTDLPRAVAFYQKIFGLRVVSEDKPNEIVRLGGGGRGAIVSLHHKAPTGIVDHFALGIENFNKDAVTQTLKGQGITTQENLDYGFYIKDPEGMNVQIVNG